MQGIFIDGRRPKSKKEVQEAVATMPDKVEIERTAVIGNEYGGPLKEMGDHRVSFVGPDPYTSRKFYGTIIKRGDTYKVA